MMMLLAKEWIGILLVSIHEYSVCSLAISPTITTLLLLIHNQLSLRHIWNILRVLLLVIHNFFVFF